MQPTLRGCMVLNDLASLYLIFRWRSVSSKIKRMSNVELEELSNRCHRILDGRVFIVQPTICSPWRRVRLGRLLMKERDDEMSLWIHHRVYTYTTDVVYAEVRNQVTIASYPLVYEALSILRAEMILDDLADIWR